MSITDTARWSLDYKDSRSCTRVLFSLPPSMHRDLKMIAKARDTTVSDFLRQMITREIAEFLTKRPDLQPSFKGQLPDALKGAKLTDDLGNSI